MFLASLLISLKKQFVLSACSDTPVGVHIIVPPSHNLGPDPPGTTKAWPGPGTATNYWVMLSNTLFAKTGYT